MEIRKATVAEFIGKMEEKGITSDDYMCVIEELSYLATDNGFDKEGFFDELIYLLND